MKAIYITIFILISIPFIGCEIDNHNQKVVIYAASSMSDLLTEAYEIFKQKHDIEISFNLISLIASYTFLLGPKVFSLKSRRNKFLLFSKGAE